MRYLMLVMIVACSKPEEKRREVPVDAAPAPVAPSVASFANFDNGQLIECVDVTTSGPMPEMKDTQPISVPCGKAFADRPPLGRCIIEGATRKTVVYSYDFERVGLSDESMADCLKLEGTWSATPRTSPLFARARSEHARRKLQEAAAKLGELGR